MIPGLCLNGKCISITGGYRCMCSVGYKLTMDGKRCQGKKLKPDLFFILNGQIWFFVKQCPPVDVFLHSRELNVGQYIDTLNRNLLIL